MSILSKLAPFIAGGILSSSLGAYSQNASDPDPNESPSTAGEEATLPKSSAKKPQLAKDPDPDVAPSTAGEEAQLPSPPADTPERATDPDPDLAPSTSSQGTTGK